MTDLQLHPDFLDAIKRVMSTVDIDGKIYARVDTLALSREGLVIKSGSMGVFTLPVLDQYFDPKRDCLTIEGLDLLISITAKP